ncbi:MAG: glycerol kinase [Gemmatimonadota bacterium]|nr:glycerol kinase [Gemmatimonadota bacterium]
MSDSSGCILALDQGTTGSTALVVAQDGRILGRGYREITQSYPAPGEVEHDANEILEKTLAAGRDAISAAKRIPDAIGITNQRETVVCWDRTTGQPTGPAIVWQDRRTAARCAELATKAEWIYDRTGLFPDPYFSATKLELILSRPREASLVSRGNLLAGTVDSWLIWKLTGGKVHATEPSNASRTMLFDIGTMEWSAELCELFSVPTTVLPQVRESSGDFGRVLPEFFGAPIPIRGVAGDQQAALFGQGCWRSGEAKNTYGTGAFLMVNTGMTRPASARERGLLTTVGCNETGKPAYALEAAIFIAGAAVQWLRDGLGIITAAKETEEMARSVESNGGVYFVPALAGLGAPHWQPEARGTIVGITGGTRREHLVRATLEAMAYSTADIFESLSEASGASFSKIRVDGGASANDWLMQFQADVLGIPVERPEMIETTASGAAGLAGLAAGIWTSADDFLKTRRFRSFEPASGGTTGPNLAEWRRAVRAALSWAEDGK